MCARRWWNVHSARVSVSTPALRGALRKFFEIDFSQTDFRILLPLAWAESEALVFLAFALDPTSWHCREEWRFTVRQLSKNSPARGWLRLGAPHSDTNPNEGFRLVAELTAGALVTEEVVPQLVLKAPLGMQSFARPLKGRIRRDKASCPGVYNPLKPVSNRFRDFSPTC
eukprot:gnl/Spiro4/2623_TR1264_c0_g1_i1.p2 gnl/Spiro4/2623_TR1264_c0_g1~~gnl/Spiro4/2623_TR1264_c0_g1_i1.p2  ORF type:complete len:170 (+),score=13.15 gnl/Spiro4/2623_TR1264_c0_g1_i1:335-844(+)